MVDIRQARASDRVVLAVDGAKKLCDDGMIRIVAEEDSLRAGLRKIWDAVGRTSEGAAGRRDVH